MEKKSPEIQKDKHAVHWFRRGLRIHDNPSLREGILGSKTFRCVYIFDPVFKGTSDAGINKWRFLLDALQDLDLSLRSLNSRLFVVRGQPTDVFPELFKEWGVNYLTFEEDPEPFTRIRDNHIRALCADLGIKIITHVSHTLYHVDRIIEENNGYVPLTYQQFLNVIVKMEAPPLPQPPILPCMVYDTYTPISKDHNRKYGIPTIEELGFNGECLPPPIWKGGESEAIKRLERYLERKAWVASLDRPIINSDFLLASQTGLSPYFRFGCLSVRLFYYRLNELYRRIKKATPPLSLHGQLLWREFLYCVASKNMYFDKMVGNPICVQIPWEKNSEALAKWANGQTGYPWIDAIMTQLREEGWIHIMARQAVVCFLTRGDLWVSWEDGMRVFDELLLDADWSINAGMWMWLSCSSFFKEFFHCYCPVKFGRIADPNGEYIKKYLPMLKNIPTKYIHEPWMTPGSVQQTAKCIIGLQYPLPIVNHQVASKINIARMRQIYQRVSQFKEHDGEDNTIPTTEQT